MSNTVFGGALPWLTASPLIIVLMNQFYLPRNLVKEIN